jgi:ADP-heptose:LPS heptosyltransferase
VAGNAPPLVELRNFLLLQYPLALGTAIHATPLIAALHASVPGARVAAAASGFGLAVLQGNPGLEQLVETPSPLTNLRGTVKALRSAKFFAGEPFAVLQTQGNERSRVTLAAMLSGGHRRVGFAVLPELTEVRLRFDPRVSQIANNLRIVEALGHGSALMAALQRDPDLAEPRLYPSSADTTAMHALLAEEGIDESRPIALFITQTSISQRKSWRPERFRAVATGLAREYGMQIVFAGATAEAAAIDDLRAPLTLPTANLAGRTGIQEMAALLQLADVALTLDTGPMHLARAMRLPMVVVAPAWSPPVEWLPLGNPRAIILKNLDLPAATPEYIIDEVSVEEVETGLRRLLQQWPPRTFGWRS